jgi:hypothetical protein
MRMAGQNPISNLAAVSLRQLRDLARSLGILRDGAESKASLSGAINEKIPRMIQHLRNAQPHSTRRVSHRQYGNTIQK